MMTDFWDIDVSDYLKTNENKFPDIMFTDDEIKYIKEISKEKDFDKISIQDKLKLANNYRKSFNIN